MAATLSVLVLVRTAAVLCYVQLLRFIDVHINAFVGLDDTSIISCFKAISCTVLGVSMVLEVLVHAGALGMWLVLTCSSLISSGGNWDNECIPFGLWFLHSINLHSFL